MDNNFTEFEKTLLNDMNRRAMLIIQAEEFLRGNKIAFNKDLLYQLPDDTLRAICDEMVCKNGESKW